MPAICNCFYYACTSTLLICVNHNLAPRGQDRQIDRYAFRSVVFSFLHECLRCMVSLRREVRTCASLCECSLHPSPPCIQLAICISYLSQKYKFRWTGLQPVKPLFVTLTYGSQTVNRTDSLYQTINGLVGNVDWGESLTVAACEFPGTNKRIIIDLRI